MELDELEEYADRHELYFLPLLINTGEYFHVSPESVIAGHEILEHGEGSVTFARKLEMFTKFPVKVKIDGEWQPAMTRGIEIKDLDPAKPGSLIEPGAPYILTEDGEKVVGPIHFYILNSKVMVSKISGARREDGKIMVTPVIGHYAKMRLDGKYDVYYADIVSPRYRAIDFRGMIRTMKEARKVLEGNWTLVAPKTESKLARKLLGFRHPVIHSVGAHWSYVEMTMGISQGMERRYSPFLTPEFIESHDWKLSDFVADLLPRELQVGFNVEDVGFLFTNNLSKNRAVRLSVFIEKVNLCLTLADTMAKHTTYAFYRFLQLMPENIILLKYWHDNFPIGKEDLTVKLSKTDRDHIVTIPEFFEKYREANGGIAQPVMEAFLTMFGMEKKKIERTELAGLCRNPKDIIPFFKKHGIRDREMSWEIITRLINSFKTKAEQLEVTDAIIRTLLLLKKITADNRYFARTGRERVAEEDFDKLYELI